MNLPYSIKYTTAVKAGDTNMFFARINPKYKEDTGLHAHEYAHIKQWYVIMLIFSLLLLSLMTVFSTYLIYFYPMFFKLHGAMYATSKNYRQYCEVNAFKAQLKHYPEKIDFFAKFMATNYDLGITIAKSKMLLED